MSGGGGSKNTTTTTKSEPWKGVQPWLEQGYGDLAQLYGQPVHVKGKLVDWNFDPSKGPQYFPGQTVVNPSGLEAFGQQQQLGQLGQAYGAANMGMGALGALSGAPGQTAFGLGGAQQGMNEMLGAGRVMQDTGFNLGANPAMQQSLAQGQQAWSMGIPQAQEGGGLGLQSARDQIGAGGVLRDVGFNEGAAPAMQRLLAAGDPTSNPYFQAAQQAAIRPITEQFTEQVLPSIRSGAIGAGQMGSSRQGVAEGIASRGYANAVADAMARMGSEAYGQGLQAMQAAGGLGSNLLGQGLGAIGQGGQLGLGAGQLGQGFAGMGLQGAGQAGQLGLGLLGTGANQIAGGAGLGASLYGTGLESGARGAALAPSIQQMGFFPGQQVERIGQQQTADAQAQRDAEIARWNYQQNLPFSMMSDYLNMLNGAGGGQTSSAMQSPGGSLLGRVAGGGLTGAGLMAANPAMMPWGALGGGLLGLFG